MDSASAPLVVLFERDDSIAVPLLSLLRRSGDSVGYQVRSARTPIEMFAIISNEPVTLVLVDLSTAASGKPPFWTTLYTEYRGRALQVLTFRLMAPLPSFEIGGLDHPPTMHITPDVVIDGARQLEKLVDAVHQRLGIRGAQQGTASITPL